MVIVKKILGLNLFEVDNKIINRIHIYDNTGVQFSTRGWFSTIYNTNNNMLAFKIGDVKIKRSIDLNLGINFLYKTNEVDSFTGKYKYDLYLYNGLDVLILDTKTTVSKGINFDTHQPYARLHFQYGYTDRRHEVHHTLEGAVMNNGFKTVPTARGIELAETTAKLEAKGINIPQHFLEDILEHYKLVEK